jgi:hypothetical protein
MAFQYAVAAQIGAGVVGELAFDGPFRGQPAILRSADATQNIVGRACTIVSGATGSWQPGSAGAANPTAIVAAAGGAGIFAGILANPKVYANLGVAGFALGSSLTLPNENEVELVTEGDIFVSLPGASNPGDSVYYLTATGALVTTAPNAAKPVGTGANVIGTVVRFVSTGAGIAVIHLEPVVPLVGA